MFKVGQVVMVIDLDQADKEDTNLKIGDIGTVCEYEDLEGLEDVLCNVIFGEDFVNTGTANIGPNGSYIFYSRHLEAVEVNKEAE